MCFVWLLFTVQIYLLGGLLAWRTVCWLLVAGPAVLVASFLNIPESPYWLVHHGYLDKAKSSLQWYRCNSSLLFICI